MKFFLDGHVHSCHSDATSKYMTLDMMSKHASIKGIKVISTGDCLHREYIKEIKEQLEPSEQGLFSLKELDNGTRFILSTEVNCSCVKNDVPRRTHILIFFPTIEVAEETSKMLNLFGDMVPNGRPTLVLSPEFLAKHVFNICPESVIIPAHIGTPWYGLLGENYGYESVEEAFGSETEHIYALESGLSADPEMISVVTGDRFNIVSFGDAHSAPNLGRELTAFDCDLSYDSIMKSIKNKKQLFTIEFFPQMGKYFLSGHRDCHTSYKPKDAEGIQFCPVCKKKKRWTQGVLYRLNKLRKYESPYPFKVKYAIPLKELISTITLDKYANMPRCVNRYKIIQNIYDEATSKVDEISILLSVSHDKLLELVPDNIASAIVQVRKGMINIKPGYDGLYGVLTLQAEAIEKDLRQREDATLFNVE